MIFNNTYRTKIDLSPAKWIWYPSERTLSNTFAFFRKEFVLDDDVLSAEGNVVADSRYRLYLNGDRIQWGPAPSDPRYMEVDPMNLTGILKKGKNAICFHVLYYGFSEGTWVAGTPGLLFKLNIKLKNGQDVQLISDSECLTAIDWSHQPGGFQRWYLRSLQEICDGRKVIPCWNNLEFDTDDKWTHACEIGNGDIPSICTCYSDYANDGHNVTSTDTALVKRDIPMLKEYVYDKISLAETGTIKWTKDKDNWFLFREPNIFTASLGLKHTQNNNEIEFEMDKVENISSFLTFEIKEQVVGFPLFVINAPEGTTIEIISLEGHTPGQSLLLDSGFYCWSRYICHSGDNYFEAFDFESSKWLQLNIYNANGGKVIIKEFALRRRIQTYNDYHFKTEDQNIQKLFDAGINTIYNAAQETLVDGMGRERQQYSGDCSHMLIAMRYALGDKLINERFIQTYVTGMTKDGLFLDSWPGADRLKRIAYRQIDMTIWGNIVDHSIQFVFDCYKYYLSSGNLACLQSPMLAFEKLIGFLIDACGDELYPTDDRNSGFVWLDHEAYSWSDHKTKECAINIYIAGMIEKAYIPLCKAFDYDEVYIRKLSNFAKKIIKMVTDKYWCSIDGTFYDNLPYVTDRKDLFVADRTLSMAIVYDYCKDNIIQKSVELLKGCNDILRLSYPANSVWRMWGLAKAEALDTYVKELYSIWSEMPSVKLNSTYQEFWTAIPDSISEWSHIPSAPLVCFYEGILGLKCNNIEGNHITFSPQFKGFCSFETEIYNNGSILKVRVNKKSEGVFKMFIDSRDCDFDLKPVSNCNARKISDIEFEITYF